MDAPKWFDMRELTYKDDFDLILKRQGWYDFSYQRIYNDPQVINHRLLINGKTYATFFKLFGDTTFRKILSFIFSGPRTKEELEQRYGGKKLDGYLDFLKEQEIAVYEDGFWRKAPRYAHVQDISRTLEWYVAEWFRYELKAPARHGVHIEGIGDGGDLDGVAFVVGARIMVECKSGDPANITEAHLELFLRRAADFNPDIALLLIDTDQEITKQLEMLKKVYLQSDHIGPKSFRQWNTACVHVRNVKNGIDRSLRETLRTHSANKYDDRPLIGLPTNLAEAKEETAHDQINASEKQSQATIEAVNRQIDASERQAKEALHNQHRPVLIPGGGLGNIIDSSDGWRINWGQQNPVIDGLKNIGAGPAFNIYGILFDKPINSLPPQQRYIVWNYPTLTPGLAGDKITLQRGSNISSETIIKGYTLYVPADADHNGVIARFTLTYHDVLGRKYASIYDYHSQLGWISRGHFSDIEHDIYELDQQTPGTQLTVQFVHRLGKIAQP